MTKYLSGAAVAALVFSALNLLTPRATAQGGEGLPRMPQIGDVLFVEEQSRSSCTVKSIHANWVTCEGGVHRNLVTGAAYTIQQPAK